MLGTDGFSFPPRKKNLLSAASGLSSLQLSLLSQAPISAVCCEWEEVSRGREDPGLSPCLLDHLAELWRIGDPLALLWHIHKDCAYPQGGAFLGK